MPHLWLNRFPVSNPEHIQDLESLAAVGEFGPQKMPRHKAEEEAHAFYQTGEREKAMAHHLRGMKVSQAHGDTESSQKHALMYAVHARALGHNPYDAPPSHVAHLARQPSSQMQYSFKPHESDVFAVQDHLASQKPKKPAGVESVPEVWTSAVNVKKAVADMLGRVLKKAESFDLEKGAKDPNAVFRKLGLRLARKPGKLKRKAKRMKQPNPNPPRPR